MEYVSTRGGAPVANFETVLLAGLAPDGGLYVPRHWPSFSENDLDGFRDRPYADVAASVLAKFTQGTFSEALLKEMAQKVYRRFDHPETAPLREYSGDQYILELFHGPTLAFKDFAMQILGAMFDYVLERSGKRLTVLAATSGDTGAAAIDALAPCKFVDIVVLHPENRVTEVQRRMMTCIDAPNVVNLAVKGSFDDCQAIVKDLFQDRAFVDATNLSGVNSINWARIAAQTVYYFTTLSKFDAAQQVSFAVPTGNFGDIFAGYVAKKMGAKIDKLIVATNANDILHRALSAGDYSTRSVCATAAPSMDIQIASNFERILFDAMGRDHQRLENEMVAFKNTASMQISKKIQNAIQEDFVSYAADDQQTLDEMALHYKEHAEQIDPHTAIGRIAAKLGRENGIEGPIVTLSTAHPAKFPDAVKQATRVNPPLPLRHQSLFDRPEIMSTVIPQTDAVKSFIMTRLA